MKIEKQKLFKHLAGIAICTTTIMCATCVTTHNDYTYSKADVNEASIESESDDSSSSDNNITILEDIENNIQLIIEAKKEADYIAYRQTVEVYDGLTLDELSEKLNKNLKSTLSGKGELFAEYSTKLGLDPYLAVSIVLLETGCNWECSQLVKQCNNVGGIKGAPGCWGGSYQKYNTLDDGIKSFMDLLYNNYYSKGLKTPEQINPKYAESKTWAQKVNKYMQKIKAS